MKERLQKLLETYRIQYDIRKKDYYGAQVDLYDIIMDIEDVLEN